MLDREADQRRQISDPELLHQSAAVRVDGVPGKEQLFRDLGTRGSADREMQHFALASAQALKWAGSAVIVE
jgi:hypothetical protein